MSTQVLPDVIPVLIDYLLTTDVADDVSDRIQNRLVDKQQYPCLLIHTIADAADHHHWVGRSDVTVEAIFHANQAGAAALAKELASRAVARLWDMPSSEQEFPVRVVDDLSARPLEDPVTANRRYLADLRLTVHPAPGAS